MANVLLLRSARPGTGRQAELQPALLHAAGNAGLSQRLMGCNRVMPLRQAVGHSSPLAGASMPQSRLARHPAVPYTSRQCLNSLK